MVFGSFYWMLVHCQSRIFNLLQRMKRQLYALGYWLSTDLHFSVWSFPSNWTQNGKAQSLSQGGTWPAITQSQLAGVQFWRFRLLDLLWLWSLGMSWLNQNPHLGLFLALAVSFGVLTAVRAQSSDDDEEPIPQLYPQSWTRHGECLDLNAGPLIKDVFVESNNNTVDVLNQTYSVDECMDHCLNNDDWWAFLIGIFFHKKSLTCFLKVYLTVY